MESRPSFQKRPLRFQALDEINNEVRGLLTKGYRQNGNWNLSQIAGHLDTWTLYTLDGFPVPPFPMKVLLFMMRYTVAPFIARKILSAGFSSGSPTFPATVPPSDMLSDLSAAERYLATLYRLDRCHGPFHASPLFGTLDRSLAIRVALRHAEHHLAFLEPHDSVQTDVLT
jgi:hypothetical protein